MEEDKVTLEIPVYLSKALLNQLYMVQYPVRPSNLTNEDVHIYDARIKPKQRKLQVTAAIDGDTQHYDYHKSERLAETVRESHPKGDTLFPTGKMDRQMFESDHIVSDSSRYAVGYLTNGELHLSPLTAMLNLKPSFTYMDKKITSDRSETATKEKDDDNSDEPEAVKVKFARQETERMKLARERSFRYQQARSAEEQWIPLRFHSTDSVESELDKQRLVCGTPDDEVCQTKCPAEEYLKALVPALQLQSDSISTNKSRSLTQLRQLPLTDQVNAILINARVVKFDQLLYLLTCPGSSGSVDCRELIISVQQHAYLVRGVWVVKSDTLYAAQGTTSIPPNLLARGRDYILYMFTQKEFINRRSVTSATKLPADEIEEILNEVAVFVSKKGWRFKLNRDVEFEKRYPDTVHRQEMLWEARQQQLSKEFKEQGRHTSKSPSKSKQRKRNKSGRESFSSDGESGCETAVRQRRGSGRIELDLGGTRHSGRAESSFSKM